MNFFPFILIAFFTSSLITSSAIASTLRSLDNAPVIHFTLARRGGAFAATQYLVDYVNLTYLAQELETTEARFNLTKREVKGNKLIRKAKKDADRDTLMGEVAARGIWCVNSERDGKAKLIVVIDAQVCQNQHWQSTARDRDGFEYAGLRLLCTHDDKPKRESL